MRWLPALATALILQGLFELLASVWFGFVAARTGMSALADHSESGWRVLLSIAAAAYSLAIITAACFKLFAGV